MFIMKDYFYKSELAKQDRPSHRTHNPVTVNTISKWIVNNIQMPYDNKKHIKAH